MVRMVFICKGFKKIIVSPSAAYIFGGTSSFGFDAHRNSLLDIKGENFFKRNFVIPPITKIVLVHNCFHLEPMGIWEKRFSKRQICLYLAACRTDRKSLSKNETQIFEKLVMYNISSGQAGSHYRTTCSKASICLCRLRPYLFWKW